MRTQGGLSGEAVKNDQMSCFPLKHKHLYWHFSAIKLICVTSHISYFERMHT